MFGLMEYCQLILFLKKNAKWLVINSKFITYTCKSDHGHVDYKDVTEDLLINKKDLYND